MAHILVVDDEVGIRELLSEILADEGHQVSVADSAGEARRQALVAACREFGVLIFEDVAYRELSFSGESLVANAADVGAHLMAGLDAPTVGTIAWPAIGSRSCRVTGSS